MTKDELRCVMTIDDEWKSLPDDQKASRVRNAIKALEHEHEHEPMSTVFFMGVPIELFDQIQLLQIINQLAGRRNDWLCRSRLPKSTTR